MKISKRLTKIASYVDDNSHVIDVGTDHALLAIYLVKNKKNVVVVASDNKVGPLEKAKENIKKYAVDNEVQTSLADGLEKIDKSIDTVIIAGMGYHTIKKILEKGNLNNVEKLIISVNDEFNKMKKLIKKIKFYIKQLEIVEDNKKFYLIIESTKRKNKTNIVYNNEYKKYLEKQILKQESILKNISHNKLYVRIRIYFRIKQLKKELQNIK